MDNELSILKKYNPKQIDEAVKSLVKKHWGSEEMARVFLAMDLEEAQLLASGKEDYEVGTYQGGEEEARYNVDLKNPNSTVMTPKKDIVRTDWITEALNNPENHWKSR